MKTHSDTLTQSAPLTAYVADMSYFSGKLEAYLRYKEIPHQRKTVDIQTMVNDIFANTHLMKVPVVKLADGSWLKDTTPMLDWFDQQKQDFGIYPEDPVTRFVSLLLEDYADEWCWRSALYWRWYFPETKQLLGRRIGKEILGDWPIPERLAGWYFARRQIKTYLKGDGVTRETEPVVKKHYTDMLNSLQSLLVDSPFLLGNRPSIVDFGFFGPMFRHFGLDPAPAKVMIEQAPAVYEWLARLWNAKGSNLDQSPAFLDFSHQAWNYFLKELVQVYVPFLKANALAWQQGRGRFDFNAPEVTYPELKTLHYRVYCLEDLQNHFLALDDRQKESVRAIFEGVGGLDLGPKVVSGLAHEFEFPLRPARRPPGRLEKFLLMARGTPWDMPRRFGSERR